MNPLKDGEGYAFVGLSIGQQMKLSARNGPGVSGDKLKRLMIGEEGGT